MENHETSAYQNNPDNGNFIQTKLPNATAVLVLGIISIVACCCYGIGIILGIIGLVLANKDMKLYNQNPKQFTGISNVNTGKILSIIGIILGVLFLALVIYIYAIYGIENYERDMMEWSQQMQQAQ